MGNAPTALALIIQEPPPRTALFGAPIGRLRPARRMDFAVKYGPVSVTPRTADSLPRFGTHSSASFRPDWIKRRPSISSAPIFWAGPRFIPTAGFILLISST